MITAAVASVLLAQGAQPAPGPLVSKMLAKYFNAKTIVGSIQYVQTAGGKSVEGSTRIQIERPHKLYIFQTVPTLENPRSTYMIVADGRRFAYSIPPSVNGGPPGRMVEPMVVNRRQLQIHDVYASASLSLLDRSAPIDIAVGRKEDLAYLRNQWATVQTEGLEKIDGVEAHLIGGDWRAYGAAPVSGKYQMAITPDGDLLRYRLRELVQVSPQYPPLEVVTTWKVKLDTAAAPDARLFKV